MLVVLLAIIVYSRLIGSNLARFAYGMTGLGRWLNRSHGVCFLSLDFLAFLASFGACVRARKCARSSKGVRSINTNNTGLILYRRNGGPFAFSMRGRVLTAFALVW